MIRLPFVVAAAALFLVGCATLPHRDRAILQEHGVTGAVYEKMLRHEPLSLEDIVYLSGRGVPGPYIVHYLQPTYVVYKLTPGDVNRLQKAGVREGVIRYLASTPAMFSPNSVPLWSQDDPRSDDDEYLHAPGHFR